MAFATCSSPCFPRFGPFLSAQQRPARHQWFADAVIVVFLVAQILDGIFTYLGVRTFGTSVEANPLIGWLMTTVGEGPALAGAKLMSGTFGIALHLTAVHRWIAILTIFYFAVAILPWIKILFF